jgi:hypothetical protein
MVFWEWEILVLEMEFTPSHLLEIDAVEVVALSDVEV